MASVLASAAISRFLVIFFAHADAGDTPTYELFATNILRGCGLSFSDPGSSDCVLTSGGYFPGYPAFIALVWMLFGKSIYPLLVAQLICYLLALYWLLTALMRLTNSTRVVFAVGMLLALSPLQVGWFRFVLTEPLAIAAATWFLAELIISIADKKLRKYHLALALSASVYIRPDTVFMALGIFLVSFYIYGFKNSIKQILIVVLLTSIPISGWMIRNLITDHAPLSMTTEAAPIAPGYYLWLDTWVVNEYERADANFPVWRAEYSKIKIHGSKFVLDSELSKAQLLIKELAAHDGEKFPAYIDRQFQEFAKQKISSRSNFSQLEIYATRACYLLFNPFSSWGLPLEIKNIDRSAIRAAIDRFGFEELGSLLVDQKMAVFGKMGGFIYRGVVFLSFGLLVIVTVLTPLLKLQNDVRRQISILLLATAVVAFARTSFFVVIGGLESRYLVEIVPSVECCVAMWFFANRLQGAVND